MLYRYHNNETLGLEPILLCSSALTIRGDKYKWRSSNMGDFRPIPDGWDAVKLHQALDCLRGCQ